jgi:hypothetical protein
MRIKDLESAGPDAKKVTSKLFFYITNYTHRGAFRNEACFPQIPLPSTSLDVAI